jgi:rhodanese-related sulfurtransferase
MSVSTITREELKQKMDRGDRFVLLDVLSPETFATGRLPGAVNLPYDKVASMAAQVIANKHDEVIVYCSKPS